MHACNPREILERHWGYRVFRGLQEDVINAVMNGRDTLVVMATGSGKSLCMQVPAIALGKGTGLIISPLISLMEDQVACLVSNGVRACFLGSAQSDQAVSNDAWTGKYQVSHKLTNSIL